MTGFTSKRQMAQDKVAQPVQKPVAWISALTGDVTMQNMSHTVSWAALYTTPPQRTWVGLTDDEISATSKGHMVRSTYARAIEAALKEKNFD